LEHAIVLDPEEARALLEKTRKKWRSRIRGFKDQIFKTQHGAINLYAQAMAEDTEQAMAVAASGDVQFAEYSSNIICLDEDLERLHENTRMVMKKIQNLGFACRLETINAVEAWRGSIPGGRLSQCPSGATPHTELGGFVADHVRLGGSSREPFPAHAKEQPAFTVRRHDWRDAIQG
jgi:type IV secretion system protein VirB4